MLYGDKKFLNDDPREMGSIAFNIESPKLGDKITKYDAVGVYLQMQDCSNRIDIDLSFKTEKGLDKRLAKLDVIIETLSKGRIAMEEAWLEFQTRKEEADK